MICRYCGEEICLRETFWGDLLWCGTSFNCPGRLGAHKPKVDAVAILNDLVALEQELAALEI